MDVSSEANAEGTLHRRERLFTVGENTPGHTPKRLRIKAP